jgi:hypothetical protein
LRQAYAVYQAVLLLLVRRLLLQAIPAYKSLLHAAGCNLRTLLFILRTQ